MIEQWQELKKTITEMRDNNGTGTQQEVCKFLANLMDVLEKQIQEPCEAIKEIPKDYKYDTETEDFLVYRHMYTGHEIHIEKPVPRYRLEQECEDCISRQYLLDNCVIDKVTMPYVPINRIQEAPPVISQLKTGYWIFDDECKEHGHCPHCGYGSVDLVDGEPHNYCPKCGEKLIVKIQKEQ